MTTVTIGQEADGFTISVGERSFRFSHYFDEDDYDSLKEAILYLCGDEVEVEIEEVY